MTKLHTLTSKTPGIGFHCGHVYKVTIKLCSFHAAAAKESTERAIIAPIMHSVATGDSR